jgi:hypothetical protein
MCNPQTSIHGVTVLLGCDATSLVTGSSFSEVPCATQDTRTIFHFLQSATSSHFTAWHKGTYNAVAQSNLPHKRIPQPHRCESLNFVSTYVIHYPSVTPCVSKSYKPIEKLTNKAVIRFLQENSGQLLTLILH